MFPEFTKWSIPLIIMFLWGTGFFIAFLIRYFRKKQLRDLILASIIGIHTYHRINYIVGFMAWYDTFQQTKIDYFLMDLTLLFAPLIYFYVRSVTQVSFAFKRKHIWHFVPVIIYVIFRCFIFIYDVQQDGFDNVQNGTIFQFVEMGAISFILQILNNISTIVYLILAFMVYASYAQITEKLFGQTYKSELFWIRNFLLIFATLFVLQLILAQIDNNITSLHYTDFWWGHMAAALSLIYLGVYGYRVDLSTLSSLNFDFDSSTDNTHHTEATIPKLSNEQLLSLDQLKMYMIENEAFRNADLKLGELASKLKLHPNELSFLINKGCGLNFNDYINEQRVEWIKLKINQGAAAQYTLLSLAYDAGFNSKATFNRTFKKWTNMSPSEYLRSKAV